MLNTTQTQNIAKAVAAHGGKIGAIIADKLAEDCQNTAVVVWTKGDEDGWITHRAIIGEEDSGAYLESGSYGWETLDKALENALYRARL